MRQLDSEFPEQFSLDGPNTNPLAQWSYDQALDFADELDLADEDWELIHNCYSLTESFNGQI